MTVQNLIDNGYQLGKQTKATGYISRLITLTGDLPVCQTKHSRWGYYYVDLPSHTSTRFHYRQYFIKTEDNGGK